MNDSVIETVKHIGLDAVLQHEGDGGLGFG